MNSHRPANRLRTSDTGDVQVNAPGHRFAAVLAGLWRPAAIVLLLLGPVLGAATYFVARAYRHSRAQERFDEIVAAKARAIDAELTAYASDLRGIQAFYYASDDVRRSEFSTFTRVARERHPVLLALEWAPRVPHDQRGAHEWQARTDGPVDYRITEVSAAGIRQPAGTRSVYYPVRFAAPERENSEAIGLDLGSEEVRREALERAAASEGVVVSRPLSLVQSSPGPAGVLMVLAVHEDFESVGVPGRPPPRGFVVAVFQVDDLVAEAIARSGLAGLSTVAVELFVGDESVGASHGPDAPGTGEREAAAIVGERELVFGGRGWKLRGTATSGFPGLRRGFPPLLLALLAFGAWELAAAFLLLLTRMRQTMALQRQDRVVHSVLRSLSEGVVVADRDGKIQLANKAALRIGGTGARRSRSGEWATAFGIYLPDGQTPYPEQELPLARAIRGERVDEEYVVVRNASVPDGAWVRVSGTPLRDERGAVTGGVVVLRDVTAQRRADEKARRLSMAVEQTEDTVFITDSDGHFLYVNPGFEATTGYTRSEVVGCTPRILRSSDKDDAFYKKMWDTILRGEAYRGAIVNRRKNGDLYHCEQTITSMKDEEGRITHFVAVCKDMTERRRIQEQDVEMRLAARVQERLYPRKAPKLAGLDVAGAVVSAEATCGDYYDYLELPGHRFGIAVGDVSGHGLGPALVMAETRAYLRSLAATDLATAEIFRRTNLYLLDDLLAPFFVTLLFVTVDCETREVVWANAGHTSGYVLDAAGDVRCELSATGPPLGLFDDRDYERARCPAIRAGEVLVLMTDGATESRAEDGSLFGEEGVLAVVREHRHESAETILNRIREAIDVFTGGRRPTDDVTVVVCKAPETLDAGGERAANAGRAR